MTRHRSKWAGIAAAAFAMILADGVGPIAPFGSLVGDAQARIGRPATPGSVAGVRGARRAASFAARPSMPAHCRRVVYETSVNGGVVWRCGGTYYQPYGGRYVVVYID